MVHGVFSYTNGSLAKLIGELEKGMRAPTKRLGFELAAQLRERIKERRAQKVYKT